MVCTKSKETRKILALKELIKIESLLWHTISAGYSSKPKVGLQLLSIILMLESSVFLVSLLFYKIDPYSLFNFLIF